MLDLSANLTTSESPAEIAPRTERQPESVSGYRFRVSDLRVADREPGISAFMRIRNGAEFLELSIRSHIELFDEIVAVYNRCTDATPEILMRLQREFGPNKLRVIHYEDQVFPPGSDKHASTNPTSPHSLVNYYNFALAATRYSVATKLDDDHLAIKSETATVTEAIRAGRLSPNAMHCFSGLNVFRRSNNDLGILSHDPISGNGDIGFFRVTPRTYFTHDRRFERFRRGGMRRRFAGFLYWHLKYMKDDMGFGNYDIAENTDSRYASRQRTIQRQTPSTLDLAELARQRSPGLWRRLSTLVVEKHSLLANRDSSIASAFPEQHVAAAITRTVAPEMQGMLSPWLAQSDFRRPNIQVEPCKSS